MNEFEKEMQRQPMRNIPAAWEREILAAAAEAQSRTRVEARPCMTWSSALKSQLTALFWPNPKAWGGLAAAWGVVFALNLTSFDSSPMVVASSAPTRPEMRLALREQRLLLAELINPGETPVADRPKLQPQPHSERRSQQIIV